MKIYIIANFTRRLDGERESRFSYLADKFAMLGHDVELIITDFWHGSKCKRIPPREDLYPFKITQCHEPGYKKNIGIRRLYSHYVWGKNVEQYLCNNPKPDIIYCAIPSITAARRAGIFAHKVGAKFVVDVQDLWPEAFCMAVKNKILQKAFLPMKWYVDRAYRDADVAIGVSDTYVDRILSVNKRLESGVSVFLGNNGELFYQGRQQYGIQHMDKAVWLCYVGSLNYSYDIKCVIDALAIVEKRCTIKNSIRFVVIGNGYLKDEFENYARSTYSNCDFVGSKPYQEMVGIMCSCDIVINPIVKGSAASIINKVGDYAMSGLPVINTQECPEYRALLDEYKCGINCRCENAEDVADAIERLASDETLRKTMGNNASKLGFEKFDRRNTYQKIIDAVCR